MTSGTWEVSFWYYTNYGSMNTERAMFQIDSELYARDLRCSGEWLFLPDGSMWPTSIVPNATWVPVRWQVDLDKHTCQVWFDGTLVYTGVFPAASLTFVVGSLNGPIVNGYIDDVSITPFTP